MSDPTSLGHEWGGADLVAEDAQARVFRLPTYDTSRVWHHAFGHEVGAVAFLVQLRPEVLPPRPDPDTDDRAWARQVKARIRAAMRLVPPALAGFPDWPRIRADDAYLCSFCATEAMPGGVCVITTYRRALNRAKAQARRSLHFSAQVRRALLTQAAGRCRRCGAVEALEVDHIVPIGLGGNNDLRNGWVLCRDCHLAKTRSARVFSIGMDIERAA